MIELNGQVEGVLNAYGKTSRVIGDFTITKSGTVFAGVSDDHADSLPMRLLLTEFIDETGKNKIHVGLHSKRQLPPPWWGEKHKAACARILSDYGPRIREAVKAYQKDMLAVQPWDIGDK